MLKKLSLKWCPYTVFHVEFEFGVQIGPNWPQNPILSNFQKIRKSTTATSLARRQVGGFCNLIFIERVKSSKK